LEAKTKDFSHFFPFSFSPFGPELTAEGLPPFTFSLLRTSQLETRGELPLRGLTENVQM
jgi:hypothetical protein